MGVEGHDSLPETSYFASVFGVAEALSKDTTLCELGSTLDQSVQHAIIAIVRSSARE